MSTDPRNNLPSSGELPKEAQRQLEKLIEGGLGGLSLREILAMAFKALNEAERRQFLTSSEQDKANGFYERALQLGSIPLELEVPRTRSGQFRPSLLPAPYQRSYPEETQSLLLALLASSRSINAAKTALRKLGLSASEQELETVAREFIQELELRNTRPLDTDLFALFIDAKYVELRDGDPGRYGGKGVLKAVAHVNGEIAKAVTGHALGGLDAGVDDHQSHGLGHPDILRRGDDQPPADESEIFTTHNHLAQPE